MVNSKKEIAVVPVENQSQEVVTIENQAITEETIKNYFCKNATSSELALGAMICRQQGLNPFTGDVHFIKYGEQKMQVVVSKYAFLKRAERNPNYDGFKAWVESEGDDVIGKCEVYRKDRKMPIYSEVYLSEYKQGNKMWNEKPKTMIRKVAVVQAHREAFPDDLSQLFTEEEISTGNNYELPEVKGINSYISEINKCNTLKELLDYFKNNQKEFEGNKEIMSAFTQRRLEIEKSGV